MKNLLISNKYPLLLFFAFMSGISSLIYQITWIRQFSLFFGVHVLSVSTVLAAFMTGLAIGNYLFGRLADRGLHPLILLVVIESGIGLFALLFQPGIEATIGLYGYLVNHISSSSDQLPLLKFILSFFFLLVPTTLMGGVIPVLSKFLVSNLTRVGNKISWIYSLNNLGAAAGCLLAGFFLIRMAGIQITILSASCVNLFNAIVAGTLFFISEGQTLKNRNDNTRAPEQISSQRKYPARIIRLVLWVFAIEGFTTLAYEVLWNRIFIEYVLEKNTYYYTVIIFSFITGLSAGSFLIRKKADDIRNQVRFLGILEIIIGISSLTLLIMFVIWSPQLIEQKEIWQSWITVAGRQYILIFLVLIIPASLMGVTFPLVSKIFTDQLGNIGKRIGFLGFLDTAGSILGSFVAGFLLIRFAGVYYSFLIVVLLNLFPGLLLAFYSEKTGRIRITAPLAATVAFFLVILLLFPPAQYFQCRSQYFPEEKILAYYEGASATVSVNRIPSGHLALVVNGAKTAFSSMEDVKVHTLLACLPYVFTENPRKAFVIGYGMGVTVNCLSKIPGLRTDVAEISREVMEASEIYFAFLNDQSASANNVNLIIDDGRSYLFRSGGKYDIVTTNSVHPRLSPNLYTLDFYQLCANKMNPDGVICQWLPTNWMTANEFGSLVKAFTEVFPNSGLWYVSRSHLLLLGSKASFTYDFKDLSAKISDPGIWQLLIDCEIYNSAQFASMLTATDYELNSLFREAVPDRDNHPVIEYSKEINLAPNREVLRQFMDQPFLPGDIWKNTGEHIYREQIDYYYNENNNYLKKFFDDLK
jgi:spermidine synthase